MNKRTKRIVIGAVVAAVLAAGTILLVQQIQGRSPEALLRQLAGGKGDREEIVMRLNVARGDVVQAMIKAFNAPGDGAFRADVLDLLFKRYNRVKNQQIEDVLRQAVKDGDPLVRRCAAKGIATYGDTVMQAAMADAVDDSDAETRRQALMVMAGPADPKLDPHLGSWEKLTDEQIQKMVQICLRQAKSDDPELRQMARAIIGRQMEVMGYNARQKLQASDVAEAEKMLRDALTLDPENHLGRIRLVRFLLQTGRKDEALQTAREFKALLEIPALEAAPVIDGDPTEAAWGQAATFDQFYRSTARWVSRPTDGKTRCRMGHRDGIIYIAVLGYEDDLDKLVMKHKSTDWNIFEDDCVEICFDPSISDKSCYKPIITAGGAVAVRAPGPEWRNVKPDSRCRIFKDRGYWACEMSLDTRLLTKQPAVAGTMWAIDVFRARVGGGSEHCALWPPHGGGYRVEAYPIALFK